MIFLKLLFTMVTKTTQNTATQLTEVLQKTYEEQHSKIQYNTGKNCETK